MSSQSRNWFDCLFLLGMEFAKIILKIKMGDRVCILTNMYSQTMSTDVTIKVEGDEREIKAHRVVLMGASVYFQTMFKGDFQDGHSNEVMLKEINFDALQMLVEFVYTGKLQYDKCTFLQAIETADYLAIECAIKGLNTYVSENITVQNCIEMYEAFDYLVDDIGFKVESFIRRNLSVSPIIRNLLGLNIDQVGKILKNPTPVERALYDLVLVVNWVKKSTGRRCQFLPKLLPLVVFTRKPRLGYLYEDLLPICLCAESKDFFIALLAKANGNVTPFTNQFFNEKNWKC